MQESDVKLDSRYREVETRYVPIDSCSGYVTTTGEYVRCGLQDNYDSKSPLAWIDFEGGPMLRVGSEFQKKKIKSIRHVYLIELE